MEETDHHLIVGKGAQEFARDMGFKIEDDLNTEHSRKPWLEWKRRTDPLHYLDPIKRAGGDAPGRARHDRRGADRSRTTSTARSTATASTRRATSAA